MTDAFVHVIAEPSAITETASAIADREHVKDVHLVTGEHDIVAQLELETKDEIAEVVTKEIHSASGVVETVTNVAFEL